jgi:hypothetical protein
MPLTFDDCELLFRNDGISELGRDAGGTRYLKLRSLSRKEGLERLFTIAGRPTPDGSNSELFRSAFQSDITIAQIETCMRELYTAGRAARRAQEPDLINQLYRLQEFNWGGLHQNSLEKTIVDNYVKKIKSFDRLTDAIVLERTAYEYAWLRHVLLV